mmetsp:Transcript_19713/g.62050  ORF Transcript_19713/g.62050 Transcript_19713/m.62050 type:complete len:284 (+) Transcript_19713:853-1704(+)
MLETPWSSQQCSSSPMIGRVGHAESVVLPVPESPKRSATSPRSPTLAAQCIVSAPRSRGSRKFITVKMPFFISPVYSVPPTRATRFPRCSATKFSERSPCRRQSASVVPEALYTVKSGANVAMSGVSLGRKNMFFTKWCCQALAVTKRTLSLREAPAYPSKTKTSSCAPRCSRQVACSSSKTSGDILPLFAHHASRLVSSATRYLSFGDRPVNFPVSTAVAPSDVTRHSPLAISSSRSREYGRLWWMRRGPTASSGSRSSTSIRPAHPYFSTITVLCRHHLVA